MNTPAFDASLNCVVEDPTVTNDDLELFHALIMSKLSQRLSTEVAYMQHAPDHRKYADLIAKEIRAFGGNTLSNVLLRAGEGPSYHDIVCDVAKAVRAPFNRRSPVDRIERSILETVCAKGWEQMSEEERRELLDRVRRPNLASLKGGSVVACQYILRVGGFASYQLMLRVANGIAWAAVGHGLPLAVNAGLAKAMSVGIGPAAWAASTLLTLHQIAGPSYKVIIPSVIHVGALRLRQSLVRCPKCKAEVTEDSAFCSECGTGLQS